MDFMNRGQQSNNGRSNTVFSAGASEEPEQAAPAADHKPHAEKPARRGNSSVLNNKWFRLGGGAGVIVVAVLIAAVLAILISYRSSDQSDLVDTSKLQAVFLTNDQVYFGKITDINSKYLVLTKIYYLQTSSTGSNTKTSSSNISLVKLGCELHKPQDQMVISKDQVSFWENLQADGQVAKAVKSYQDANPNGQKCSTTTQNTNPVQGSSDTTNTNNTNNTTTQTPTTNNTNNKTTTQ